LQNKLQFTSFAQSESSAVSCLNGLDPVESDVEEAVEGEADHVEAEEVEVEADDALPLPVLINLGVGALIYIC
jgi:hypothetical protein